MKIVVKYWIGTTRFTGKATTYKGAIRVASKNRNASPPHFYDEQGKELYDTGAGLAYDPDAQGRILYVV